MSAVVELLQDGDVAVQANAAGVLMYTGVITTGTSTPPPVVTVTIKYYTASAVLLWRLMT